MGVVGAAVGSGEGAKDGPITFVSFGKAVLEKVGNGVGNGVDPIVGLSSDSNVVTCFSP